jgi:hypothetical protein
MAAEGVSFMIEPGAGRAKHLGHRILAPLAIAAVVLLLGVTPASAAVTTRYVEAAGADSGDCASASAPCKTITYALTQSVAGDTIHVAAGEYDEVVRIDLDGITIEGSGASTTIVIGPAACAGIGTTFLVFGSGVTVRGLGIGGCPEGIVAAGGPITVESDLFLATTGVGVSLAGGSATVLNNVFRSHSGVCDRAPGTVVVSGNTFLTQDYGICVNFADATVHFNRITNQPPIGVSVASTGTANLEDNWWGCNDGPNKPGCATTVPATARVDRWLVLAPIGAPTSLAPGASAQITFGLVNSVTGEVATTFPSAPIAFATTTGSVSPPGAGLVGGVATTTFTAPSEAGVYTVTATLDEGTASVTLNAPVVASPSPTAGRTPAPPATLPPTSSLPASAGAERSGGPGPLAGLVLLFVSALLVVVRVLRIARRA